MNRFLTTLALILGISAAAQAEVVRMNSWQYANESTLGFTIKTDESTIKTSAGAIQATLNGDRFLTYNLNLSDSISWGTTYSNYRNVEAGDRSVKWFTEERATDLGRLNTGFASQVNDATSSAAFQLAAWAIVNETGSYSVRGNDMDVSALYNSTLSEENKAIATAETWLHSLPGYSNYTVSLEYSSRSADLMMVAVNTEDSHHVPEPASFALSATALALMTIARRRNSARD